MKNSALNIAILFFASLFVACQATESQEDSLKTSSAKEESPHLGQIDLSYAQCPTEAKASLEEGMLLLHSFEYDDARTAFQAAQAISPNLFMAVWGEAMTHNHPLWRQQERDSAILIMNKLGSTPEERLAKAANEVEKDLWQALETLYGEGEKTDRDQAYAEYLKGLHQKHPDNNEVSTFYALSLLGSVKAGRDDAIFEAGAQIAQKVMANNPRHPGALHYLIHAYDDPYNAPKAILAANNYSKVAPDAAHALHMPSHIYVAMGMWEEVVKSNINSYQASVDRMERLNLGIKARSYHALHWLMYGYLQQNRFDEAKQQMHDMIYFSEKEQSVRAKAYLLSMKANYLVETNQWDSEIAEANCEREDLNISKKGLHYFIEGMKAHHNDNQEELKAIIQTLEEERQAVTKLINEEGLARCSASSGPYSKAANKVDINQAHVMEMELRALYAEQKGDLEEAEKWHQEAMDLELNTSYAYGPPAIAKPSFELYAEFLNRNERYADALQAYEQALKRGPNRLAALKGQLQAAKGLKDQEKTDAIQKIIDEITQTKKQLSSLNTQ